MLSARDYYAGFLPAPLYALTAALAQMVRHGPSVAWLAAIAAGLVAWTLIEYLVHRCIHRIARERHWLHHIRPRALVGVRTWQLAAIGAVLFLLLVDGLGMTVGGGAFSGIAGGYTAYTVLHHLIHFGGFPPGHRLRSAFDRHMVHHGGVEANFGVVTSAWDRLFGTYVRP